MKVAQPPPVSNQPQDPDRPTIVCLCGSTRFWREFQETSLEETLAGRIVLSLGAASASDEEHFGHLTPEEFAAVKEILHALHLEKIKLADEVFVINPGGYIGESTHQEILFALEQGKRVRWQHRPTRRVFSDEEWRRLEEQTGVGPI